MHACFPWTLLALKMTIDLDNLRPFHQVSLDPAGSRPVRQSRLIECKSPCRIIYQDDSVPTSRQAHPSIWIGCPSVSGHEVIAHWPAIAAQESVDGSNAAQLLALAPQQSQTQDQLTSVSRLYLTSSIGSSRCPVPRGDW